MKVEFEMYIGEDDEQVVMEKVSKITNLAKQLGFRIKEIEVKSGKVEKEEEEEEELEEEESGINEI